MRFFLPLILVLFFQHLSAQSNFQNVAFQKGINHTYTGEITGGGVSFVDFDQDGLDDITLATGLGEPLSFYKNAGNGFIKIPSLVEHTDNAKQVLWIDFDNDGDNDLFVASHSAPNRLYENTGDLHLIDITESVGIHINDNRTYGAAFADYNRDGWLDLYFCERFDGQAGLNQFFLYQNNADGTFTEVSETTNTKDLGKVPFCASFLDYNNDKWPDIYIAHDRNRGNTMLQNLGNGTFQDVSEITQTVLDIEAMSVAVGDYNNDGWSDIYCTNIPDGSVLLQNQGFINEEPILYNDVATEANVGFYGFGWGANFFDADNDSDLDLYISGNLMGSDKISSAFYSNQGNGSFDEFFFEGDTVLSYNNAIGDFNNDGLSDIIVVNQNPFKSQLWENKNLAQNWLKISLQGRLSNKNGIGSKLEIFTSDAYQMRYTHCGIGFLGQNSLVENIGLSEVNQVDSLLITWPTGHVDRLYNISSNQHINITEGSTTNNQIDVDEDVELLVNEPPSPSVTTHFVPCQDTAQINHIVEHASFMGGGAAFFDYDNDGDDDLYVTSGKRIDHFYENQGDGTFINKNTIAGFDSTANYYTMGVVVGDIDNDGFKDLFITTNKHNFTQQLARNLFYKNNGDGTFTEMWGNGFGEEEVFSIGATFFDYNLDGLLDLYVINYVESADFLYDNSNNVIGFNHDCFENLLYENQGNGTFQEKGGQVNLDDTGCALAVASTDFDFDGDQDILIANDFGSFIEPNKLYENNSLYFSEIADEVNINTAMYGMGTAIGDIDKDLDLDYYVTNFGKNALSLNNGGSFTNITDDSGTGDQWVIQDSTLTVGWGTAFIDIDNDTDLDLFVSNGYVPSPDFLPSQIYQNDKLFVNNGDLTFTDTYEDYGISNRFTSRGMAYSDFDNDGDVDILSVVLNVPINEEGWQTVLNRNEWGNQNNWFQVSLEGVEANRDGYGSRVLLYANEEILVRELSSGSSHCSNSSSRLHFGLGDAAGIDSLQVWWPGAKRLQTLYDLNINERIHIVEDTTIAPITTSIVNLEHNNSIRVYPNPSSGQLIIDTQNVPTIELLTILNGLGQVQKQVFVEATNKLELDISDLNNGLYYLLCSDAKQKWVKKIVVQK